MILFNYKNFLVKESKSSDIKLIYSDDFINILNGIGSDVSKTILGLLGDVSDMSYIDITDNKNFISFIQSGNVDKILSKNDDPWKSTSRQQTKVGKLIKKLLSDVGLSKTGLEEFVNDYKSTFEYNDYEKYFEVIKGDNMSHYYYCDNQIPGGQLGHSCMGEYSQQPFIQSFYNTNPEKINMLILKDRDSDNIVGRANLWNLDKPSGRIFMDRIYTNDDYLIKIFIRYATKNNYLYKKRQIYGGSVLSLIDNGKETKMVLSTKLNVKDYSYYPYVDTLQFYNKSTGEITSDVKKWDDTSDGDWVGLIHAGGRYLTKDNDDGFKMDYMGRLVHPYFVVRSEIDDCYIHKDDAIRLKYKNDYCTPDRKIVKINNNIYLEEDTYFDKEKNEYRKK